MELQTSCPDPKHGQGRPAALLSMEASPGSLNNLYSWLRKPGGGVLPQAIRRKLWELADKPRRNLCEMAVLFCFYNQQRQTHAALASFGWSLEWWGEGGPLFRRNLPAAGLGAKADTMLLLLV